jgi:hypothetical protein
LKNRGRAIRLFFHKWRHFWSLESGGRFAPHPQKQYDRLLDKVQQEKKLKDEFETSNSSKVKEIVQKMVLK